MEMAFFTQGCETNLRVCTCITEEACSQSSHQNRKMNFPLFVDFDFFKTCVCE